jgi:hypothetical protein
MKEASRQVRSSYEIAPGAVEPEKTVFEIIG